MVVVSRVPSACANCGVVWSISFRMNSGSHRSRRLAGFRDDLASLLPELDCVVHPAEREGLGVAVLEALSCRVPVVASAVGGLVDIIEHESTGLLVEPDDDRALLAALLRMLHEPGLRQRLGEAGRRRVETAFSVASMTSGNLSVYREIMKRNYVRN